MRVGDAHFSVAVEQLDPTAAPIDEALTVQIILTSTGSPATKLTHQSTRQQRLFQRYYEADLLLPTAGEWAATISIDGTAGHGEAPFTFTASPPQRIDWTVASWGTLAVVAVLGIIWAQRGDHT